MANGLMNLSNLLGQSSNASGLLGGGIFSQPESRGSRRSRLLTEAISGAGADPYSRLGATFGGLIGMGARAGAEGLGIVDEPPEVQRNNAIRQVQQEVAELGLDPLQNPAEFGEVVSNRFRELNQPELALRTQLQMRQMAPKRPELEPATFYDPSSGEYVQGAYRNGIPVNPQTGAPLPARLVESDFEVPGEQKGKARNVRLADGNFIRGVERPDGTLTDIEGNVLPETATVVGLNLQASEQEDLPQSRVEKLNTRQIGVENYTNLANEAIEIYNENPSVNSLAAEGSRILRGIRAEFDSFLDLTGVDLAEGVTRSALLDPESYNEVFEEIGLENAALKPLYLSLALQQAQAEAEQTGKSLSDKDIALFLRQQGNNYADPEIATEILTRNAERLQSRFVTEYERRTGEEFTQEFPQIREYQPRRGGGASESGVSSAARQAISSGPEAVAEFVSNATEDQLAELDEETSNQLFEILSGGR